MKERDKWALKEALKLMGITAAILAGCFAYVVLLVKLLHNPETVIAAAIVSAIIGGGIWMFFQLRK